MKTYDLLIRLVTPKLKDPLSKAEEPGQPFRLVLPITPIATQSRVGRGDRDISFVESDLRLGVE